MSQVGPTELYETETIFRVKAMSWMSERPYPVEFPSKTVRSELMSWILPGSKHIVEQARLVWVFSHAKLTGFGADGYDNSKAAKAGVDFLLSKMLDNKYGGYYWSTDEQGGVIDDNKYLYGQSFVLFSLSTYYRATSEERARVAALDLLDVLLKNAQENSSSIGGFYENFARDWTLLSEGYGPVSRLDTKTSNVILHWMESLTEAVLAFNDETAKASLEETLNTYVVAFYTPVPENAVKLTNLKGDFVETGRSSDGHLIEYAYLRIEAEKSLGRELDWALFDRYFKYVVSRIDPIGRGVTDSSDKFVWWAQTELIAAISVEKQLRGMVEYEGLLLKTLDYMVCKFIDPSDNIFYWSLARDGSILDGTKANKWKVGYHAFRGVSKFVNAFQAS